MDSYQQKTTNEPGVKPSSSKEKIVSNSQQNKKKLNPKIIFGIFSLVLLIAGGLVGLYLTSINQDLRQQASVGGDPIIEPYKGTCKDDLVMVDGECVPPKGSCKPGLHMVAGECISENLKCVRGSCPANETCHCQDGQQCDFTACEDDYLIENCEDNQGRSYCKNSGQDAWTCCAEGYECCPSGNGCCGEPNPTSPPNDPTPTTPPNATPTPTTPPDATPTPTTPVGPQCRNIEMYNIVEGSEGSTTIMTEDDDADLIPGESTVRLICSSSQENDLPTGYFYAFRIYEPCQSPNHFDPLEFLNNEGENGVNYPIVYEGDYQAQCAVCTVDSEGDNVCDWEALTVSSCED